MQMRADSVRKVRYQPPANRHLTLCLSQSLFNPSFAGRRVSHANQQVSYGGPTASYCVLVPSFG